MKCAICEAEGKTSRLNISPSPTRKYLGEKQTYWEEDGTYHSHSPDRVAVKLWCSEGHKGIIISGVPCPGCDFGKDEKIEWEG